MAYGVQPYDPSKPVVPKPSANPMVNSYGAPLQPPTQSVPAPQNYSPSPPAQSYGVPQANTSVPKPPGYQGGGDWFQMDRAGQQQMEQDRARVESDPTFRQSEIDRTNNVIKGLGNADTSAQQSYLSYLGYKPPQYKKVIDGAAEGFNPDTSGTTQIPTYSSPLPTMNEQAIREYARNQVARKLADLRLSADQQIRTGKTTADQQLKSLDTQNQRLKTTIGEDRSVQDVQNGRNWSPYSGRSDFAQGMLAQQRGRQDQYMQEDYANRQANVNADLANLQNTINEKYAAMQNASPDEQEKMFQDIKKDERNYDLMLHGEYRNDTLANSQLNNTSFQQQLASFNANRGAFENDRNFGLNMDQFAEQQKQNNMDIAMKLTQTYGKSVNPTQDYSLMMKQVEGLDPLVMQTFQEDKKRYGEKYALDKLQVAIAQQNANTSSASQQNSANNSNISNLYKIWENTGKAPAGIPGVAVDTPLYKAPSAGSTANQSEADLISSIDMMSPDNRKLFFKDQKAGIIAEHGLDGYNKLYDQYYDKYGDPITK